MSRIKKDIENCMVGPKVEGPEITSSFIFSRDFSGFQGHFPSGMVLPGACQVQAILSTVEKGDGRSARLRQITVAKYFAPVFPDERIDCSVNVIQSDDGTALCKARITRGGEKISEIRLKVALQGDRD